MSERNYSDEDLKLFDDIKNGAEFDESSQMPALYRKALLNLLWMQGDSEYSGALGYMPWIEKAPTLQEKVVVAQIVKDEMRHASVIYRLLRDLGQDVDSHIAASDLGFKMAEDQINIGFKRVKEDFRVNIFYYNIKYWTDFILFNFLMDRAAGHQLEDTFESSYSPWKKSIAAIYKEEVMHLAHGDKWVSILCEKDDDRKFLQERLNLWWPRVMNVFGNPQGSTNDFYVRLGLKKRTNAKVREAFVTDIKNKMAPLKLTLPEYKVEDQPQ